MEKDKTVEYLQKKLTERVRIPVKVGYEDGKIVIRYKIKDGEVKLSVKNAEFDRAPSAESETVINDLVKMINESPERQKDMCSYENAQEHLILRPLSPDTCEGLMDFPHILVGDITLVLYAGYLTKTADNATNFVSCRISREAVKRWGMDEKTVLLDALANMAKRYPALIFGTKELYDNPVLAVEGRLGHKLSDNWTACGEQSYLLHNTLAVNSAIAAFYPGVLDKIADRIGDDLYLAFTSVHEVWIHAAGGIFYNVDAIECSLRDANACCNTSKDILTDQVYFYSRKDRRLEMIVNGEHTALDWIFE